MYKYINVFKISSLLVGRCLLTFPIEYHKVRSSGLSNKAFRNVLDEKFPAEPQFNDEVK